MDRAGYVLPGTIALFHCLFPAIMAWRRSVLVRSESSETARLSAAEREEINARAERLLERHGNSVLRLAYSYLHSMDDAEEILQESLIRFLKTAPRLENERHEKAWLLRVAGNLSKNRIAYDRLRRADQLEETLAAEQREDLSFVWEAVKRLPSSDREVIHLFYYEGFSAAEIAGILGQKEPTVRSRLMRGREKLKHVLKEAYDFGESV
jgi:RNA polymerase sigma-70 factor (ECF subfamily)